MIKARVDVRKGWGVEFATRINAEAALALTEAAKLGADVAAQAAEPRRRTGKMETMEVLPTVGAPEGWIGGFKSEAWYAGFQSRGTKTGIKPLHFLEKGRLEARKALIERLNRL